MSLYPRIARNYPSGLPEHPQGDIFYVHAQLGSNSSAGDRREKPFETIAYALTQCADDHNDIIKVTTSIQVEDQPIVVNKRGVQIHGLPINTPGIPQQARCWLFPDGHVAGGVFTLGAGDIVLKDFMLWGTAGQPCIDFDAEATAVRQVIRNCSFHVGSYGIQTGPGVNTPSHYLNILDCFFDPALSSGGILLASNGSWPLIANCFFELTPGPQISITGGMAGGRILDCIHMLDSDTQGEAITLGGGPTRWVVKNNVANDATVAAMTANPFQDDGTDNMWIGNSKGGGDHVGIAPA